MAKKRKSKLFRGNTKKMLAQGVSLASMFPKLKDLEGLESEDKSALDAEALIQEERIQDEALQKTGQDVWGIVEDVDDSPIRIQLSPENSLVENGNQTFGLDNVQSIDIERINAEERYLEAPSERETLSQREFEKRGEEGEKIHDLGNSISGGDSIYEGIEESTMTEHLKQKYKSIASITEKSTEKYQNYGTTVGVVNIFEASLPMEEDDNDDVFEKRREKRYRNQEVAEIQGRDVFEEILSRALHETTEEEPREESEEESVIKQESLEQDKNASSSRHYIEENFGLDILESDLTDYHHNLGDTIFVPNDVQEGLSEEVFEDHDGMIDGEIKEQELVEQELEIDIQEKGEYEESVSKKDLFAKIDMDLLDEDSKTDPKVDEIPDGIFSLTEDETVHDIKKPLDFHQEKKQDDSEMDEESLDLFAFSDVDVTDPALEDFPEDFQFFTKEDSPEGSRSDSRSFDRDSHDENSQKMYSETIPETNPQKLHFARPLLPIDEDGVPSVIIEEWDFEEDGEHSIEQTIEYQEKSVDEEHTMISLPIEEKKPNGKILYKHESEDEERDGVLFAFDDVSITDGIQINLGHTEETVLGEEAWNISLDEKEELEPTIHENARPVPILRLKSKRSQNRRQISTENFVPISKDELEDNTNPILESQRITIGQSTSKFPLFLISFILGVLIFAFVAAC